MVSSLLDKLVDDLLSLTVTLLLQVTDERVQVAWTVVRLHDRLVSLDDTSDPCKHIPTCRRSPGWCEGKCRCFLLTFQQQSQRVCEYQQSSFLTQIASRRQQQILLGFGGELWEGVWKKQILI